MRIEQLPTTVFPSVEAFVPLAGSAYIYGELEVRSLRSPEWKAQTAGVRFVHLMEGGPNEAITSEDSQRIELRSRRSLFEFLKRLGTHNIYLDYTGLPHHIWAPILRAAWSLRMKINAVYVQPSDYKYDNDPDQGEVADLSESFGGISPLPGFATLSNPTEEQTRFVPILGFEGSRFAYLLEQTQPLDDRIIPVVGLPGFRPEYPFKTFWANRLSLAQTRAWQRVRYAGANCPFSVVYVLEEIAESFPNDVLKIAMLGTKSHALGAVLFKIMRDRKTELIYDHPRRRADRSISASTCLVYRVAEFLEAADIRD